MMGPAAWRPNLTHRPRLTYRLGTRQALEGPRSFMDARVPPSREFNARLDAIAAETDALLDHLLDGGPATGEIARPPRLLEAMRHASLGGGKRLRPFLVVETAALFDVPRKGALMAGAALECIHCYSLVH